jgi:glycosyltransferase involved in cell wall biosynthesis
MRVAYVCADRGVPIFGRKGCSIHVQAILRAFLRHGDEVDLYAARLGGETPAEFEALRIHRIETKSGNGNNCCSSDSPVAVNDALLSALRSSGIRYDLVYERHALWSSSAMEWAEDQGIDGVLEINAPLVDEQLEHRRLDNPQLAGSLVSAAMHAAKLRVAVSFEVAARHGKYGFRPEDFLICPNGFDPDRFPPLNENADKRESDHPFTVGFLGTLKPWHGLDVLLEAFSLVAHSNPVYRLLIVGDGPLLELLDSRLTEEGLRSRATLTGSVDPSDVPRWLGLMDVGTAPYANAQELYFSPLKLVEYMAAGLPVVASRGGQIEELVTHEKTGLLVEPGNALDLAAAIKRLREKPEFARDVSRAARTYVLENLTWDAVLDRVLSSIPRRYVVGPAVSPMRPAFARQEYDDA